MINDNFPEYGKNFWCADIHGNKLYNPQFPQLLPFLYLDKNGNLDGDGGWILLEDFNIFYKLNTKWYNITCKAGFDYDGASIPRIARSLVGDKMAHDIIVAALFHDLLYCVHHELLSKKESDNLLYNIILCYNGTKAKAEAVLLAVKTFGLKYWNENAEIKIDRYLPFFQIKEIQYVNG